MNIKNPYLRLMRLHQPVGIWLLFWPCAWSLLLAAGTIDIQKMLLFFIGAVLMRGAGCVINDIIDRDIDKQVERTKIRPLASGELSVKQAIVFLALLLFLSLLIAIYLGKHVVLWSALSLILVITYPFMKRITWWPQLFLGLVFNWGVFMGWVAVRGAIELPAIYLYIGGVLLTLGYDTIYALQDKKDDIKIGVRSSAVRLGAGIKPFVLAVYIAAISFIALAIGSFTGFIALIPAFIHVFWQVHSLNINIPESAKRMFCSNIWLEALIYLGLLISLLVK